MEVQSRTDYDFVWEDTLLITDFQQPDVEEQVKEAKNTAIERVLHIHYGCDYIGVGILNKKGNMGCFSCYERQYNINNNLSVEADGESFQYGSYIKNKENPCARQITNTIAVSLMKLPKEEEAAYIIYGDSLSVERIYIKGIEDCKCCGTMEKDEAVDMDFTTEEFFEDKESFRVKKKPDLEKLKKDLMLYRSGMFQHMYRYYKSSYIPILCVEFNDVISGRRIRSFGRSFHLAGVESSALLEGLERYSGMLPRRKKSSERETAAQIGKKGIDPKGFI